MSLPTSAIFRVRGDEQEYVLVQLVRDSDMRDDPL